MLPGAELDDQSTRDPGTGGKRRNSYRYAPEVVDYPTNRPLDDCYYYFTTLLLHYYPEGR